MQEMGWLSIKIFKIIYFDTSFWSVWNLDYAECDRSVNPVGVSQPSPWACTFSLLKPPLYNPTWSGEAFRIVYSWAQRCSLTTSAKETKVSGEVDTWEGRHNLQEDQDRLEEGAHNFQSLCTGKATEVQHQVVQEEQLNPALPCQEDEELCVLLKWDVPHAHWIWIPIWRSSPGSRRSLQWTPLCSDISIAINISMLPFMAQARITTYSSSQFLLLHRGKQKQYFVSKCNTINRVAMIKTTAPYKIFGYKDFFDY